MLRFSLLPVLLTLAMPGAGRSESIDVAARLVEAFPPDGGDQVVRGPAPIVRQQIWTGPGRAATRTVFDAAGESAETSARAAVVVVRGGTSAAVGEDDDADLAFQLALVRMLTGLCRLDPRIRDAAAEELLAPLRASF